MTTKSAKIIYTKIDEAPALATYSLLPILQSFTKDYGIEFENWDISLAGRIIANFPDNLEDNQKVDDFLTKLGDLAKTEQANIIKLPNISASIPQLKAAISELQEKGYDIPQYPEEPKNEEEEKLKARFAAVLGSAVNPVLREGNSDRRAAASVKKHGLKKPHTMMKDWPADSKSRVAHMEQNNFFKSEKSLTLVEDTITAINFVDEDGQVTSLKGEMSLLAGEVADTSVMNVKSLREFYEEQIEKAKEEGLLLSLHLKATMMKVSDPIMFGHCVSVFYRNLFDKHGETLTQLGVNVNNGIGDLYNRMVQLPKEKQEEILADIEQIYADKPALAMVDSSKGITNLHVPNDVIIDASMPVMIRDGGRMWGADDQLHDAIAMIPDASYATIYQAVVEDCQNRGAFDPSTMGSVANVGLMAKKAEEYGSHDKTFEATKRGKIQLVAQSGEVLLEQEVEEGDIFRMCQTKDVAIRDWVKLAVNRSMLSGEPAVFWLDEKRAHDMELIQKVKRYLQEHDTSGLDIRILDPVAAMKFTLETVRAGKNVIAVTGNVLRDYLTDLFPILELGTSAKMLSIVPLLNGGGLFETGAGGSAPKHVQQFLKEGHLRWNSLGEFCALVASFEHLANSFGHEKAAIFAETLDRAIGKHLEMEKGPSRKVYELDNRGSHFYLALYWAEALAAQKEDKSMGQRFKKVAGELIAAESVILEELKQTEGNATDIGGYYLPDAGLAEKAMRPSASFNRIISAIS